MTHRTIITQAAKLRDAVYRHRKVVWEWRRWQKWARDEINAVAEKAGVSYHSDGEGCDLVWFGE